MLEGTVGQQLEHDHHRIDQGFALFSQSLTEPDIDRESFDTAAQALRHHIYVEEVFHFPVLRAAGMLAPVLVMLREHGQIWDLLDAAASALDNNDRAAAQQLWFRLASALEQHNFKEERILYPAGDQKILPADAVLIAETLEDGETPLAWTCEMAGQSEPESAQG